MKQRKANRLKNYDYSQNNYYYITTCTHNMREYFGQVSNEIMTINNFGEIVEKCWLDLSSHYQNCILDEYVVMPNHFHGDCFCYLCLKKERLQTAPYLIMF
jgi:REP element-mobilizing transposase RayT